MLKRGGYTAAISTRRWVLFAFAAAIPLPAQITGVPYSATETTERVQTLSDGTHITNPGQERLIYRDSAGRTRNETKLRGPNDHAGPTTVLIMDPVAGFRYHLNPTEKVGQRFVMPPRPALGAPILPGLGSAPSTTAILYANGISSHVSSTSSKTTTEDLGTQFIEGVAAEGRRTTTILPVGSVGNDREIAVRNEIWFSKQLGLAVLTKSSDPRFGDSITKLTGISLAEPDPALFMPPGDYTITDVGQPGARPAGSDTITPPR